MKTSPNRISSRFASSTRTWVHCLYLVLLLCAPLARADDYGFRNDYGSDYNAPDWDDDSTDPIEHHVGPPGPGDTATIGGIPVTCSGGAVESLTLTSGCNFQLSGSFTTTTFTEIEGTLSGAGTLTTQNLAGAGFDVEGGNLVAATSAASGYVNGGSLSIGSYANPGLGNYLSISASAGAQVTIGNSLINFDGGVASGATMTIPGITNGMDVTLTCDGDGSSMDIANDVSVKAGYLNVKDGASLKVGGQLLLDGGKDFDGDDIGGGGGFSGAGTLVSVGGMLTVGDAAAEPGYSLGMDSGAKMNSNAASIGGQTGGYGMMSMDGAGTVWNVTNRLGVGEAGTGELHLTNGAQLLFGGGELFAVGLASGGQGTLTADGDGTIIDARSTVAGIGENSGARGNVTLANGARFLSGSKLFIGAAGAGSLNINSGAIVQTPASSRVEVGSEAGSNGYVEATSPNGLTAAGTMLIGNQGIGAMYVSYAGNSASVSGNFFVGGDGGNLAASTGNGLVRVGAGAQLSVGQNSSSNIGLGNGSGAVGEIEVTDSGSSLVMNGSPIVGVNGNGELAAVNGATGQSDLLEIANSPKSNGTLLVYNNGTTWTNTRNLFDGGFPGTAGGKGLVVVNDGGLLRIYHAFYIGNKGLASVTATLIADPDFPNPPPPAGKISKGRIFVGRDNFGPDGAIRVGQGGVLAGKGKQVGTKVINTNVIGNVVIGLGGRFVPGGDPDVFSIQGDCDLSDGGAAKGGGETDIEVAGTGAAGTDYDQIIATGKVTLGGTLKLVLMEGYKPKVGDTIEPVKAKAMAGLFKEVVSPGLTFYHETSAGKLSVKIMSVANVPAPEITSEKTATAHVGEAFSYQIKASGLPGGYAATGLPDGLDIDPSTGLISGTPTAAGTSSVKLTSTSVGGTGAATLELTVKAAIEAGAPVITSATADTAQPDVAFTYQIVASNAPTSFAATGLPAGLSLDAATGVISGKPAKAGTFMVNLSATNASGTGQATLKLDITLPIVKVVANVPEIAVGGGKPGEFTLSIPAALKAPLTIHYKVSGSARPGTDYAKLTGTAIIKAGKKNALIKVTPKGDLEGALTRIVKLTLEKGTGYALGSTASAKVTIIAGQ